MVGGLGVALRKCYIAPFKFSQSWGNAHLGIFCFFYIIKTYLNKSRGPCFRRLGGAISPFPLWLVPHWVRAWGCHTSPLLQKASLLLWFVDECWHDDHGLWITLGRIKSGYLHLYCKTYDMINYLQSKLSEYLFYWFFHSKVLWNTTGTMGFGASRAQNSQNKSSMINFLYSDILPKSGDKGSFLWKV